MIRYEIRTRTSGVILDAALVTRIISTKGMKYPVVIVHVEKKSQKAFEKYIEGEKSVVAYSADPREAGKDIKDWKRS